MQVVEPRLERRPGRAKPGYPGPCPQSGHGVFYLDPGFRWNDDKIQNYEESVIPAKAGIQGGGRPPAAVGPGMTFRRISLSRIPDGD